MENLKRKEVNEMIELAEDLRKKDPERFVLINELMKNAVNIKKPRQICMLIGIVKGMGLRNN